MLLAAATLACGACVQISTGRASHHPTPPVPAAAAVPSGDVMPASATPRPGRSAAAPSIPPSAGRLLRVAGSSNERTRPFVVDDSWSITWEHVGRHLFSVQLIPAGSDSFGDLVVSTNARMKGRQPMYRDGEFVLQVYASDRWSLTVTDEPDRAVARLPLAVAGAGPSNTRPFRAVGIWVVEWHLPKATTFGLELYSLAEPEPWLLASSDRAASGCAEVGATGDLYLHVVTDGRWSLTVRPSDGEVVCATT